MKLECVVIKSVITEDTVRQAANSAMVSMAESAVIRRWRSASSKVLSLKASPAVSQSANSSIAGLRPILAIRRRATGPPIRPPDTRPKVAEASAISTAL